MPEIRQVPAREGEDVHYCNQLAPDKSEIDERDAHRDVLKPLALAEETYKSQGGESGEQRQIRRLVLDILSPAGNFLVLVGKMPGILRLLSAGYQSNRKEEPGHLTAPDGVRSWRAMRRALFRIARLALVTLIEAREIASTSAPTLNASRMF